MKPLELLKIMVVPSRGWDVVSSKRKCGLLACAVGGRGNISWLLGSEAGHIYYVKQKEKTAEL